MKQHSDGFISFANHVLTSVRFLDVHPQVPDRCSFFLGKAGLSLEFAHERL